MKAFEKSLERHFKLQAFVDKHGKTFLNVCISSKIIMFSDLRLYRLYVFPLKGIRFFPVIFLRKIELVSAKVFKLLS